MTEKRVAKQQNPEEQRTAGLKDLADTIRSCIMECDDDRQANVLALMLLVKALDILESIYDPTEAVGVVSFMIQDRRAKRQVPATVENLAKWSVVDSWLGK